MTDPLEPLYTLRVAAELIPFPSVDSLRQWLYRHRDEFPGRYRRAGKGTTLVRLLSETECLAIKARVVVNKIPRRTKT